MFWATEDPDVQLRAFLEDPAGLRSGGQARAGGDTTAGGGQARAGGDTTGKSCAAGSPGGSASGLMRFAAGGSGLLELA